MLRCSKKGVEAIIVVVEPFAREARPKITLRTAGREFYLTGSVLATGAGLLLPADGMDLALGPWRAEKELAVEISDGDVSFGGVISLSGLSAAVQFLSHCAPK